jgi:5-methylcytosine-specific restriction protein A
MSLIDSSKTIELISRRSPHWPTLRNKWLQGHPVCAVCGGRKVLEVHHIKPVHLNPELELDESNLVTLCEDKNNGVNCHLLFGHLGSFLSFNPDVLQDVAQWRDKLLHRPVGGA